MYVSFEIMYLTHVLGILDICIYNFRDHTSMIVTSPVTFRNRAQSERGAVPRRTVIRAKPLLGFNVVELLLKPDVDREKEVAVEVGVVVELGVAVEVVDNCRSKKTLNNVWSITNNSCRYSSL